MGMMPQGRARSGWVGVLVVVLALTASRANFPLLSGLRSGSLRNTPALSFQRGHKVRKSEGVTPSRRALESRRLAQAHEDQAEPGSRMPANGFALEHGDARGAGLHASPPLSLFDSATRPKYLELYLRTSPVSSLPPPA